MTTVLLLKAQEDLSITVRKILELHTILTEKQKLEPLRAWWVPRLLNERKVRDPCLVRHDGYRQ